MIYNIKSFGLEIVNNPEDANIIIINTCSFLESARIESIENFDSNKDTVVMEPLIKSEYFNKTNGSCFNGYKFLNGLGANTAGTYNTAMFASYFSLGLNTVTLKDQSDIYSLKLTTDQINMINSMEPYPAKSSVKRIGNYIFVKTSTDKYF